MSADKERVLLLCEALESGSYEKGTGRLHKVFTDDSGNARHQWCCLGVAGDIACRAGLEIERYLSYLSPAGEGVQAESIGDSTAMMDRRVAGWYGFNDIDLLLILPDGSSGSTASYWNDYGYYSSDGSTLVPGTLKDIAAGIRRTYLEES